MKRRSVSRISSMCISIVLLCCFSAALYAEQSSREVPRASFGVGARAGYFDVRTQGDEDLEWFGGMAYGGGIIFEYMLTTYFGVHSGVWYGRLETEVEFEDDTSGPIDTVTQVYSMPVYLITSFRFWRFGLEFLTGFDFMYMAKSEFERDNGTGSQNADITHYVNTRQYAASGGLQLKFGITRFVDIFVGGIASYYITDFLNASEGSSTHPYTFTTTAGILLKTF